MKKIILALSITLSASAFGQGSSEAFEAANARCEAARQKKLAPIRQRKIDRCNRSSNQPTAGCETFYSTYGNNSNHANGSVVRGRFYGLPECVAARGVEAPRKQGF